MGSNSRPAVRRFDARGFPGLAQAVSVDQGDLIGIDQLAVVQFSNVGIALPDAAANQADNEAHGKPENAVDDEFQPFHRTNLRLCFGLMSPVSPHSKTNLEGYPDIFAAALWS